MDKVITLKRKGEQGVVAMRKAYAARYGSSPDKHTYSVVLESFNQKLLLLILSGVEVKLPFNVGSVYVEKKKVNYDHLGFDYGAWRKTGEKLFHTNRHSDGFVAHYHWRKLTAIFKNRTFYQLTMCRAACRTLAVYMKEEGGHKKYQQHIPISRNRRAKTPDQQ